MHAEVGNLSCVYDGKNKMATHHHIHFSPCMMVDGCGPTMPDLHITVGLITAGFVRTDSDVPSLPVMSLKMKK